ncbi:MAG: hypothetical protein AAF705_09115 [Bacteroidota bacterium]
MNKFLNRTLTVTLMSLVACACLVSQKTNHKRAESQQHRGLLYQEYIQGALRNHAIVGAHWFQYTDQMITGREDGENYNLGFVDVCEVPYSDFIDGVRAPNYGMYDYRMENP